MAITFSDLGIKPVKYDIAGGHVFVVQIMSKDVVEMQKQTNLSNAEMEAQVVSRCIVDDHSKPLMTFEQAMTLAPGILEELFVEAARVSGIKLGENKNPN